MQQAVATPPVSAKDEAIGQDFNTGRVLTISGGHFIHVGPLFGRASPAPTGQ